MNKNYALITGASSGIGYSLAKEFSKNGYKTILVSRNKEKLEFLSKELEKKYNTESIYYKCDLSKNTDIDLCINTIKQENLAISVLINNAGISNFCEFKNTNFEEMHDIIQLNITAIVYLTRKLLPILSKNEISKILNVSSMVGHYPLPFQAVYAASKAFVLSFSQALRSELKEHNIQVSVLCPGNVKTAFIEKSGLNKLYSKIKANEMEPDKVARFSYQQLMAGKNIIYPERKLKRMLTFMNFFPLEKLTDSQYQHRKALLV